MAPDSGSQTPTSPRPDDQEGTAAEDRYLRTAELIVGSSLIFVGFLNVLLSISGGYEINVFPLILYFAGLTVWAHATIANQAVRYTVMIGAITAALAFFHYGEVLFWHKQVIFWATVAMVVFFMFKTAGPGKG
jgi:cation transport ATPase